MLYTGIVCYIAMGTSMQGCFSVSVASSCLQPLFYLWLGDLVLPGAQYWAEALD